MSIGDWFRQLGSNIQKGAQWLGDKFSKGVDWVHEKIVRPVGNAVIKPIAHNLGFGEAYDKTAEAVAGLNDLQKKQFQGGGANAQDWGTVLGKVGRAGGAILRKMPGVGGALGDIARKHL